MRDKILAILILMSVIGTSYAIPVSANTNINELIPNDYQDNKFKKNNDLLHDQSSTEKVEIPEEQKGLTFKEAAGSRLDALKQRIFQGEEKGTNTIKARSENLKLFSGAENSARLGDLEETPQDSSSLSVLISVFAGVCILLLILVIVIWNRSDQGRQGVK
ncbi:type VII secretion protein EssA [Bacillus salacetis]|uniref:Type VII secretion protein EssA n=1 Tax=Bacillus salacetis TaxID=2315464 RepID=A0A3A1R6V6_9BACI|nr:type VII secretion protein EssA [Bacillus salacetis]RIW38941.1 type VII secretion protein EssA [Bacillus salacetis]